VAVVKSVDFSLNFLVLGTLVPGIGPIHLGTGVTSNHFEDVLGGVLQWLTRASSVSFKVVQESRRVLANVSEVNSLSSLGKEKQAIESLEQLCARLVNSSENGLAVVCEATKELANGPRTLGIQTTGRLVEENEKGRFSGELNTNAKQLALLDVETFSKASHNSFGEIFHTKDLNDLFDVVELIGLRHSLGLTKHSTETQSFSYSSRVKVKILLLDVTSATGEVGGERVTIDEDITRDHTNRNSLSEDIQKSCLASSGNTHQGGQTTRLNPTVDIIQ
jgi:hypothetical protein